MATRLEITCINKSDRQNPHERILFIGGQNAGARWKFSQTDAIRYIENGQFEFFVNQGGLTVNVIVAHRLGHKYLKTITDGEQPDNLLSLPECPRP